MGTHDIQKKLAGFPDAPGVYFFYTKNGELVYVGKATSLRNRVKSYFRGGRTPRPIETMIHEVADMRVQQTDSVLEAIILEANEIKKHLPKYNVDGKDDKSWNYIAITDDEYPRVTTIRQHDVALLEKEKNSRLFGPYPGLNTKAAMHILRQLFHFSTCKPSPVSAKATPGKRQKPCFYYQLGQCFGVCIGIITPKEYRRKVIRPLVTFLSGRKKQLLKQLETQMRKAAKQELFEEATRLRNQIFSLQRIQDIALLNRSFVEDWKKDDGQRTVDRIEGYDISNLGPTGMVGSMVVFQGGVSEKREYRKFKIRTVAGQSDVDCLEEVLRRRLKHAEWRMPDLLLIDGGKPQVNRVVAVLADLKLAIPIVGLAKGPDRKNNEIVLGTDDERMRAWIYANIRTLIGVRDEAHRFAISYQRSLRRL